MKTTKQRLLGGSSISSRALMLPAWSGQQAPEPTAAPLEIIPSAACSPEPLTPAFEKAALRASDDLPITSKAIQMMGFMLKNFLAHDMGEDIVHVECNYFYDQEGDYHGFELYPVGSDRDDDEEIDAETLDLRNDITGQIAEFLEQLDIGMDHEGGKIQPESGAVYFNTKLDLYRTFGRYLSENDHDILDIGYWTATPNENDDPFPGYPVMASQRRNEMTGIFNQCVKASLKDNPAYASNLLFFAFNKPYLDRRHFQADAFLTSKSLDFDQMMIGTYMAIIGEQISIEDRLDRNRDYGLDLNHTPLRPSLN